jgi:DNA-binding Lrp family transcriptional regulator
LNGLPGVYLPLLMAIQENPLSTVLDLVKRVDGSKPTVIKRLSYLRANNYFSVEALLNHRNLDFEVVDVFLEASNLKDVMRLETIANNHPYTSYRARCFGSYNGLFLQFRIPTGTRSKIEMLVDILKEKGIVTKDLIYHTGDEPSVRTSMNLDAWNLKSMSWTFDWVKWFETEYPSTSPKPPKNKPGLALEWLTKNDVYMLQQLMINAKRNNAKMLRAIHEKGVTISPQTFGRRLRMLDEHCIEKYRVSFDPKAFDIITNIIVRGQGKKKYLRGLQSRMNANPIPFESTLRVSDSDLYWYVRMPPTHLSSLLTNLHGNLENMTVSIIDYSQSCVYSIWPETFNHETHSWIQDHEFMIDTALK